MGTWWMHTAHVKNSDNFFFFFFLLHLAANPLGYNPCRCVKPQLQGSHPNNHADSHKFLWHILNRNSGNTFSNTSRYSYMDGNNLSECMQSFPLWPGWRIISFTAEKKPINMNMCLLHPWFKLTLLTDCWLNTQSESNLVEPLAKQ